jgi:SAM-dependent methyltransferase
VAIVQADLEAGLPFRADQFSNALCALIGEHLRMLDFTLAELWRVLEPGGTMVFSAYHPDLAEAGKEANFELGGIEYRLGAIRYCVADYLQMASIAGFCDVQYFEYRADPELIQRVPSATELLDRNILFALRARKP